MRESLCVCFLMDCDQTVHVDSIHCKLCLCIIEYGVVMATKSGHVERRIIW